MSPASADGPRTGTGPPNILPYALGAIVLLAILAVVALISRGRDDDLVLVDGVPQDYASEQYEFVETWAGPLPRLRDGVEIVEWTADIDAVRKPERYTLRVDGVAVAPTDISQVLPLTRPITSAEDARAQANLFRSLGLAPGYGFASQSGGSPGFNPATFDEWAHAKDISADPIVSTASDGYRIVRPVAEFTDKGARIIVLRELIRPDGSYEATTAGVLADEDEVRAHRLVVSDL